MIPVSKTLETDIAVVGGGIGGLCAAIAAAEGGARVMVLEKANTKRSGSGATGNDHFACYYPKHHGGDIHPILRELLDSLVGLCHDPLLSLRFLERSISIVDKWHEWGINMKPFADDYVFMGHAYPDRPRIWLKYDGHNQKEALTRQAKKVGVTIVNHHPAVDLMRDEQGITGVLTLDVSGETPSFTFVKARKVILATGHRQPPVPRRRIPGLALQHRLLPRLCGCGAGAGLAHRREAREHGAAQPPCRAQVLRPRREVHMDRRVPLSRRQAARPLRGQGHPRGRGHHLRRVELRLYRRAHERHRPRLHRLYGHGPRRHGLHARGHGERGAHRAAQLHG